MSEPSALLVAPEPPYPMYGGGAMRIASVFHYLASRFALDLVTFQDGDPVQMPEGLCRRLLVLPLPHHSRSPAARAARNFSRLARRVVPLCDRFDGFQQHVRQWLAGRHYEIAVLEHFWLAPYLPAVRPHANRVVLDLHNVESILLDRFAQTSSFPQSWMLRSFASICRQAEHASLPSFDALWVTSPADAQTPPLRQAETPVVVFPNSLPDSPSSPINRESSLAFSANWSYAPNQSGLRWFLREVWPRILHRLPGFQLRLIGRDPGAIQSLIANHGAVECTGSVHDARAWIAKSRVSIAPLLAGSGTRLKIIEAWAAQTPVVATTAAAEGLEGRSGQHLLIEDTPESFAGAILHLLDSPEAADRMALAGRNLFESTYSWPAAWESLARAGF